MRARARAARARSLLGVGYVALVSSLLAFAPWYAALGRGGIALTSQVQLLQPLLSVCWMLCVPGGHGLTAALGDAAYLAQVRRLGQRARYLTSVCTGSLILAAAGLIQGKRAACHWAWRELLAHAGVIVANERVVRDGSLITGGGVTAGIDFALTLAAELVGLEQAQSIQLQIEYAPSPPFDAGRPESAPPAVLQRVQERSAQQFIERKSALDAALARLAARDQNLT